MSIYLLNIIFVLFMIYFYRINRKGLHIFQLENYHIERYNKWIKDNSKEAFDIKKIALLLIATFVIFINQKVGLILTIFTYLILIFSFKRKKDKKPFVITKRVKRQYFTYLLILVVLLLQLNFYKDEMSVAFLNVITVFNWFVVNLVTFINSPIEKMINNKFIRRAKNKIKSIPDFKVIGITGSYGKTSTKNVINTILSQKYNSIMTPESYNTTLGVVRTINEKIQAIHQLFVCEMGAKNIGDIKEICDIVKPNYAVITAIGPQHLETFKTIENVAKTKLELVDSLSDDGIAFVNWEDENIRKAKITKKIVKYGLNKTADYYAENIVINEKGSTFDVVMPNKEKISVKTKLLGNLNILNIVCGVAIADKLGLNKEQIKMGIKYIKPVEHRLELRPNPNGSIIIDDSYNSNVRGAKMALEVLGSFKDRQRILITPGIVDLGEKAYEINKNLGKEATKYSDFIMFVGEKQAVPMVDGVKETKYPMNKVFVAKNLDEAVQKMNQMMDNKTVILLENDLPDNYL